ncbi:hypothetical protein KJ865_00005, partial [Myxococcota bacterium]|nr:hypothetical protein [Myxococcota bacterium]
TSYDFSGEIGGLSFSGSCSPSSCEPVQAGEYTVTPGIGYLEVHGKEMLPVNVTIESTTFGTGQISITEWGNDDAILLSPGN